MVCSIWARRRANESFFHENNYFINKCNDSSISLGDNNYVSNNIMNTTVSNNAKLDYFFDENEILESSSIIRE